MDYRKIKDFVLKHNIKGKYRFTDRGRGQKKLCLFLIGYKKALWPEVVKRFKLFVPEDVDVCLLSSGKYFPELERMAEENSWSYISTKKNNVCLIQNIAINIFQKAVQMISNPFLFFPEYTQEYLYILKYCLLLSG